jgi:hypothetical protein
MPPTGTLMEAEATALLVAPGSMAADAALADEPDAAGAADGFDTPVACGGDGAVSTGAVSPVGRPAQPPRNKTVLSPIADIQALAHGRVVGKVFKTGSSIRARHAERRSDLWRWRRAWLLLAAPQAGRIAERG